MNYSVAIMSSFFLLEKRKATGAHNLIKKKKKKKKKKKTTGLLRNAAITLVWLPFTEVLNRLSFRINFWRIVSPINRQVFVCCL